MKWIFCTFKKKSRKCYTKEEQNKKNVAKKETFVIKIKLQKYDYVYQHPATGRNFPKIHKYQIYKKNIYKYL